MTGPVVLSYKGVTPTIDATAFVAPTAAVIGDVGIGPESGIWFGCVVRGDVNFIRIGARTNVQDGTVVHVSSRDHPTVIGDDVTIGHAAVIHACTLESGCFIGMKATIMDGAVVETGAMVAAGALVPPGKRVGAGQLWAGMPARFIRDCGPAERDIIAYTAPHYVDLARQYREGRT